MKKLLIFTSVSIFSSYASASIVSSNELALALMNTKHVSFDDVVYVTPQGDINIKVLKKDSGDEYVNSEGRSNSDTQNISLMINNDYFSHVYRNIPSNGQFLKYNYCVDKDNNFILSIILKYGDFSKAYGTYMEHKYEILRFEPNKVSTLSTMYSGALDYKGNVTTESGIIYPYITSSEIISRLIETGICDEKNTRKSKILEKNKINTPDELNDLAKLGNNITIGNLLNTLDKYPVSNVNVIKYNDLGYYLYNGENYKSAEFILEYVLQIFPKRTVAYLNLGDTYWSLGKTSDSQRMYKDYIYFMNKNNNGNKVPKYIEERMLKK